MVRGKGQQLQKEIEQEQQVECEDEMEITTLFHPIMDLCNCGLNVADITKLKAGGCHTVESLLMHTKKDLCNLKGMSEGKVDKVLEIARKTVAGSSFVTAIDVLARRKNLVRVTTGSQQLDALLGGGIESMSITEVFGEFRTGKTQLCHTVAVTSQLPFSQGGGCGKVAYIDTEGTFRPERVIDIAAKYGLDHEHILDNIIVARAYTHEQQIDLLLEVAAQMVEQVFRTLIIDSSTALFRVDFTGRGELADRQQKLGRMLSKLSKIAEEFNVVVLLTNQVVSDPGASAMFMTDPKKPVGGHVMAHASHTRLYLRKGKGDQRICKIYDSPSLPESEATFCISEGGIIDSKD